MDQMRKMLEQINAEMEKQRTAKPIAAALADCPKCGRPNSIEAFNCEKCGLQLRKKKKVKAKGGTQERQGTVKPIPPPPIVTTSLPEETPVVRPSVVLNPQTMRQGLLYQILLGPPRGLQEDFD